MSEPKKCTCCEAENDIECPCRWGWAKVQLRSDPDGIITWLMACGTHGREFVMGKNDERAVQQMD